MLTLIAVSAGWIFSSVAAFALFVDAWRSEFDVTRSDVCFFSILSLLGPFTLFSAVMVWVVEHSGRHKSPVVWTRK